MIDNYLLKDSANARTIFHRHSARRRSEQIAIPVVTHATTTETFLLEDKRLIEIVPVTIARLAKVEKRRLKIHLIQQFVEKQIERTTCLALG